MRTLPAIDFNEEKQLALVEEFAEKYYGDMPFGQHKQEGLRFYFENVMFSCGDATSLYCMIRHLRPRRIVEIGSGFSSAVSLDTNDLFFDRQDSMHVRRAEQRTAAVGLHGARSERHSVRRFVARQQAR
ncbi:MAG: hypothetical protein CPDRYMAC_2696 [uncultured Paraburkholderia sp.]|nr:MAG: hypothetical protein CPDRYDRY_3242 [uncultured Paraburkholderia sp.]CAH2926741.1 MAG: hypothetical protein CPDRYMAC_2696 [uncultured Paraburkholderia sp.]